MNKEELEKKSNEELNIILEVRGLNPIVQTDEDREVAINILSQLR